MAALTKGMPVPAHLLAADRLDEALHRVHTWSKACEQEARQIMKRSLRELSNDISKLEDLRVELAEATEQVQAAEKLRSDSVRLGDDMRHSAESAAARAGVVAETKVRLDQARIDRQRAVAREDAFLAEQVRCMETQVSEVDQFLALYCNRLGLAIVPTGAPHEVRVTFSLLSDSDPLREAGLTLRIRADGGGYEATDCVPILPHLDSMLAKLNADAGGQFALPTFMCNLRQGFAAAIHGRRLPQRIDSEEV